MSIFRVVRPTGWTEFRTMEEAVAWRDANVPGAAITERPEDPPISEVQRYKVTKDTMLVRVEQAGKVAELMGLISMLPASEQFLFTNFAWFWSDNVRVIGMCQALGLDPTTILAPDEHA